MYVYGYSPSVIFNCYRSIFIKSNNNFIKKNINLAYCPERIAEGEAFEELGKLPQIVGASENDAQEKATKFFQKLKVPTISTSIENAIFTKLFRSVSLFRISTKDDINTIYI